MRTRRVAGAAAVLTLLLTGCEPLETGSSERSGSSRGTHRVEYQTSKETARGTSPAKRSVVVRSGSVARVTSRGRGTVSCRIVVDGRTVARRSGSGSVTCSARVGG